MTQEDKELFRFLITIILDNVIKGDVGAAKPKLTALLDMLDGTYDSKMKGYQVIINKAKESNKELWI